MRALESLQDQAYATLGGAELHTIKTSPPRDAGDQTYMRAAIFGPPHPLAFLRFLRIHFGLTQWVNA